MGLQKRQRVNLAYQGGHMWLGQHPNSWCVNVADVCLRLPHFKNSNRNYKVEEVIQYGAKQITYCIVKLVFFMTSFIIKKKLSILLNDWNMSSSHFICKSVWECGYKLYEKIFKVETHWIITLDVIFITFNSLMWLRFLLYWDHSVFNQSRSSIRAPAITQRHFVDPG